MIVCIFIEDVDIVKTLLKLKKNWNFLLKIVENKFLIEKKEEGLTALRQRFIINLFIWVCFMSIHLV